MEELISELREAKHCLLVGDYELAYEKIQNVDDELTRGLIEINEIGLKCKEESIKKRGLRATSILKTKERRNKIS